MSFVQIISSYVYDILNMPQIQDMRLQPRQLNKPGPNN